MLEVGTEPPAGSNTCRDETSNTNKEAKRFFLLCRDSSFRNTIFLLR